MKLGILAEPPLVGRQRELAELMHSLDSALEGKGITVFVSGEAGTGKTRFAKEFLGYAKHKREITTLTGWCLSNVAIPYFPFIQAFNAYFTAKKSKENEAKQTEDEESEVRKWLIGLKQTEKTGKLGDLSPQTIKNLTFAAITKALLSISAKKPTILFIDDLHWADSASLALLHYVSRAIIAERVLVLATFRSEELVPNAEGYPHPLVEALRLMRREDLFKEIKLQNLNQASVSEIAENMIGGSLTPEFAARLAEESQGNPLFIIESLRMLSEHGSLLEEHGQWRLSVDEFGIPAKIKDIILQRVDGLKPNQKRVLYVASAIGEKFNVELLGAVLGQDSLEVLETLNSVAQSSSLVVCEGDSYRFDHDKSREALYEEISPPLRRGYHARIAERLEAIGKDAKELRVNDLAYHYSRAGDKGKDVKYSFAAGKDALARFSNGEAIKHFTHVVQLIGEDAAYPDERTGALEGLGDAFFASDMFKEATEVFDRLANMGTGVLRLRAFRKAMDAAFFQDDIPHLRELLKKAEECSALDRLENARIHMNQGRTFAGTNPARALEYFEEALRVFEEEYSLWDAAWVLVPVGAMRTIMGKLEEGLAASLRSIVLFDEVGDPGWQMEAYTLAGQNFATCLLAEEAAEMFAKAIEINEKMKMGDYSKLVQISLVSASILESTGDLAGALSESLKALEYLRKTDSDRHAGRAYEILVGQYTKLGDPKRAEEYFERLMKLKPTKRRLPPHLVEAVFFAGKNQWKESAQHFKKSLESLKTPQVPSTELVIRLNYAWALERQGRVEEARTQLEEARRVFEKTTKRLEHVNLQTSMIVPIKVGVGQTFNARLDVVNVARTSGAIVKVEDLIPPEFKVTSLPAYCSLKNGSIDMKERKINPFQVETVKLTLQATEAGVFTLNPQVVYVDDLGKTKTCKPNPVTITVQQAQPTFEVLPGRITTGSLQLDAMLLGGIPENYAVILASPSIDERTLLAQKFLEAGAESGQTTFYITVEPGNARRLAEEHPSNFFLLACNPQADAMVQNLPNVFKLKGTENLTEIDIALTKAFRMLKPSAAGPKRICIKILSDVLLQHHAMITRKWLTALLTSLKSKGFTVLAVINPQMHPQEEVQAILGLFEGEIRIFEKETEKGIEKVLRIRRMYNQKFIESELTLTGEKLE